GEYSNDYICFMSKDSERMAELLSGYIDIILKRRRGDKNLISTIDGGRCCKVVRRRRSCNCNRRVGCSRSEFCLSRIFEGAILSLSHNHSNTSRKSWGTYCKVQ